MAVDYRLSRIVVRGFRGTQSVEIELHPGRPTVLIGANNAGKSTILQAVALALNGGGYHQWSPAETDFYIDGDGNRTAEFMVQVHFDAEDENAYPAVRGGIGSPTLVHGVQVIGKVRKDGSLFHSRTLLNEEGKTATFAPHAPLSKADKIFAEHGVGYRIANARLDDISSHTPEVWLFTPQNIEAALYIWKTGPLSRLSKYLAARFLADDWTMNLAEGGARSMPSTLWKAYDFFKDAVQAFPFWQKDMKPRLEKIFQRYVGQPASIALTPATQALEEWLAQQLTVSLATDPESAATPLRNMGSGWQAVIRLAALEALFEYPELVKSRVVLLLEEPESHLHPHLRRKLRKILGRLAEKGWTIVYTTHSPEMIAFDENQVITRLVRSKGSVLSYSLSTEDLEEATKLQSRLDEKGAHEFLFGRSAVLCEGKADAFSVRLGFDKSHFDYDGWACSITQCGSVSAIPAFADIAARLGIRWCALTDEDRQADGTIKVGTAAARALIEARRTVNDQQVMWPIDLEFSLRQTTTVTPDAAIGCLGGDDWRAKYPDFTATIAQLAAWIDPSFDFHDGVGGA